MGFRMIAVIFGDFMVYDGGMLRLFAGMHVRSVHVRMNEKMNVRLHVLKEVSAARMLL